MAWLQPLTDLLYGLPLTALLMGTGLYFTVQTRGVQLWGLPRGIRALRRDGNLRPMLISTGARIGTGNIAGVAAALAMGGPGSVFWMWVMALIGAASSFAESVLAQHYRQRSHGRWIGGAAYYMQRGVGSRAMGVVFTLALLACFGGAMNALQAFQLQSTLQAYDIPPLAVAIGLSALTALCLRRDAVGRWSELLVPAMTVGFLAMAAVVMVLRWEQVPRVLALIVREAFAPASFAGGLTGSALSVGLRRGLFTNEAGMGSAPQAAAAAASTCAADQGMAQVMSVLIDTVLLCTATVFVVMLSGVSPGGYSSVGWVQAAVAAVLGPWAVHLITASVAVFAFTSILGGYYYTETALQFLSPRPQMRTVAQVVCLTTVFLGSLAQADLLWQLTDLCMGVMATLNIAALWRLRREIPASLRQWDAQRRASSSRANR